MARTRPGAATTTGTITWTRRQRARLFGTLHPHPLDPAPVGPDAAATTLCELHGAPKLYELPTEADRAAEPVLAELRRELASATPPTRPTTPERELLRCALVLAEGQAEAPWLRKIEAGAGALVPLWAGLWGLAFASRVVWSPGPAIGGVSSGDARRSYVMRGRPPDRPLGHTELWWLHLRRAILAASPGEYEAARAAWRAAAVDPLVTAATFCREPGEADKLLTRELTRNMTRSASVPLLSAVTDPKLALRYALAQPLNHACAAEFHAFHLVDNLGPAAAPVLVALLERISSGTDARRAVAAAAVLADRDVCEAARRQLTGPAATALGTALK